MQAEQHARNAWTGSKIPNGIKSTLLKRIYRARLSFKAGPVNLIAETTSYSQIIQS
jgi:hypothetical protein